MVEGGAFVVGRHGAAMQAVLRLIADGRAGRLVLLARDLGDGRMRIEDAWPEARADGIIRVPDGLIGSGHRTVVTAGLRLSTAWTQACGRRPERIEAMPVGNGICHLLVASWGEDAIGAGMLTAAAEIATALLDKGERTQREHSASQQIAALIESLPTPLVFVDSRHVRVLLNERARALLDLPIEQLHESNIAAVLARLVSGATAEGGVQPHLATDPRATMAFEIRHGTRIYAVDTRWIEGAHLSGRIWQFIDVTLARTYQAWQAQLAGMLKLTIENVREGVVLIGADLKVILFNQQFVDLFDYPAGTLFEGADFRALVALAEARGAFGNGPAGSYVEAFETAAREGGARTLDLVRSDGVVLDVSRRSLAGGLTVITARDVTDIRQAAALKDELVSTVSHELRTPLTSIGGSLNLLRAGAAGALPPQAAGLVEIAHKNSDRLSRLVNDLLDLDKLQLGKLEFEHELLALADLLEEAVEQNGPYAAKFDVTLRLELPPQPVSLVADRFRMLQVMSNLISNAAKFSPPGGIVRVKAAAEANRIRISVIDQGAGISPEFRKRLFTRFAQEKRAPGSPVTGTGLGLVITKNIVEQHGGEIRLGEDEGQGTVFHVDLPRIHDLEAWPEADQA